MAKEESYRLILKGPGLSLDRTVSIDVANRVISLTLSPGRQIPDVQLGFSEKADRVDASEAGVQTAKQFMADKNPMTNMERVTCLGYYLTHHKSTPKFKTKNLTDLNREAAQPVLSNASFAARNAANRGYLAPAGGGFKLITTLGEDLVKALPDREKLQALLKKAAPRRRKRRLKARVAE